MKKSEGFVDLVVDQNCFRSADLANYLTTPTCNAVLTDVAIYEMLKGSNPVLSATKSFAILATHPDQVITTAASGELMRSELNTGIPIICPSDPMLTRQTRQFLRDLQKCAAGRTFPWSASSIKAKMLTPLSQRQNHGLNKQSLVRGAHIIKTKLPAELRKDIRSGKLTKEVYEFVRETGYLTMRRIAASCPISDEAAEKLYFSHSLTARYINAYLLSYLGWVESSGAESMPEESATNDLHDVDYIVIGSYFHGVLSREKRVNRVYERFKNFCELKFEER